MSLMGKGVWENKLYITHSEWVNHFGGKKAAQEILSEDKFRRLPFFCCALSLQPFTSPVCTPDGTVFDLLYILPFLRKYGTNPVNGEPLDPSSLIRLEFHKNSSDEYCCPVTFHVFTDHTHIVANKVSGQVYSFDTVDRLNIKAKCWKDLVTDEPFTRQDLITIQDPLHLAKQNMSTFHHLRHKLVVEKIQEKEAQEYLITPSFAKPKHVPYNATPYSKGKMAASLTSTSMPIVTIQEQATIDEEEFMFMSIKSKGYVRLVTSVGEINLELFCDQTPRTCFNFIQLLKSNYYKGVLFHRLVPGFIVQGGDPTGTGRGGESFWKKDFKDEFSESLKHSDRGILSMANRGKNTNGSQFFFTFRSCPHLDEKHTIFGRIVGGLDILTKMENVKVENEKPLTDISIVDHVIFVDPFEEFTRDLEKKKKRREEKVEIVPLEKKPEVATSSGVGKYIKKR